jgi:hypothetical protein
VLRAAGVDRVFTLHGGHLDTTYQAATDAGHATRSLSNRPNTSCRRSIGPLRPAARPASTCSPIRTSSPP